MVIKGDLVEKFKREINKDIKRRLIEVECLDASFPLTTILYGSAYWRDSE